VRLRLGSGNLSGLSQGLEVAQVLNYGLPRVAIDEVASQYPIPLDAPVINATLSDIIYLSA
jgi:hypothetical protein